ncbi:hypothetical protein BCR34DRAFT_209489 [Clohesyomyces aquaticus]|uniref:NADH pyrophosphatase-like N-terminal domain-containing protein n=1 Tax=Clohesyomyces aquaticus TaxID=1231657 RepID=A0A1Y2A9R2_9PLEO|nr:hypothetical protein BCR34DRAFT_209489 [Clohesyomyces aquaticus]
MPLPQPELPEPAHPDVDSMLSRKFGKEVANYFSGSPLNRVSFLRPDHAFLSAALKHPSTSFLLFNKLEPLIKSGTEIAYAKLKDVQPVIGTDPFEKSEEDVIKDYNSSTYVPQVIFLGLDESKEGLVYKEWYKGQPYFAVDVTPKDNVAKAAEELIKDVEGRGLSFSKGRMHLSLPAQEAAIYAEARHLLDWNARNPFCAACGYPTLSVNAGFKRTCPPRDLAASLKNAGVHLGRVVIHSTQPWPYPANLMIGAIGQAIPGGEEIHLGHDAELDDAKWFTAEEVREALRVGTSGLGEEAGPEYKEGGLRLPPKTAIANQLMSAVVAGFASGTPMM